MRPLPSAFRSIALQAGLATAIVLAAASTSAIAQTPASAETAAPVETADAASATATAAATAAPAAQDALPLLMRQPDGKYVQADEDALPDAVTRQPCYQYNNYWCLKGTQWEGQAKVGEQRLAVFQDPVYAARAIAITLHAYRFKHNLRTPREIMTRYILSPACREKGRKTDKCSTMWGLVDKYAHRIATALGIGPDEPVKVFPSKTTVDRQRARTLFREMAHIEIGQTLRVTDELIDQGLERAGFKAG